MTTTDYLSAAYSRVPGHDQLAAAIDTARRLAVPEAIPLTHVEAALTARVTAGDVPTGAEILDAFAAAIASATAADAARSFVAGLRLHLPRQLEQLRPAGADDALAYLRHELEPLLARAAKAIAALAGATSAEDAIRAGKAKAWQQLLEIADEYAAIRRAQREVTITGLGEGPETIKALETFGIVREPERFHPRLQRELEGRDSISQVGPGAVVSVNEAEPWPTAPREQLLWAHDVGAELTVPSVGELRTAAAQHRQAARAAREAHDVEQAGPAPKQRSQAAIDREIEFRREEAFIQQLKRDGVVA